MLKLLRNKIILLYTTTTGFILIFILLIVLIYTERILEMKYLELFQNNIYSITNKIQQDNTISYTWLSQMEAKNDLLIHIEDNGISITFPGVITTPTDRAVLLKKLNSLALKENIDKNIYPILSDEIKSSIFTIKGSKNEVYYGSVIIIPTSSGWRSLSLLKYLPDFNKSIRNQRIIFFFIGLFGILALYFTSLCFVTRMLRPIEENNEKQTRFIASASHELRSPLAVISANNSAISAASADTQQFTLSIDKECRRMARLIDDMLLLASTDANTWTIKKELLEIDTLLIETYESYLPLCQQKNLKLYLKIPEYEVPPITGDKERMRQILAVLLDNALSYTPPQKSIFLTCRHHNNQLFIEVADQGTGIEDKYKKLIFDRFYRIEQSRNDKQHFGLGLSIAKELIELQGGKISVGDTMDGGATFIISFKL